MEHQDGSFESALTERKGIDNVENVNPNLKNLLSKKNLLSVDEYFEGIVSGNRSILAKAITLIESEKSEHKILAKELLARCQILSGKSLRLGITGVPGAGKSTFIEALGQILLAKGHKIAVLAIDPSSEKTKGSILGDKTRMERLSTAKNAFIRPSPSAGSLGGVAKTSNESLILCEAAGFDIVFIETVGVGQSETLVRNMTDFFLLLQIPNAGDELQGIKRGVMEMADMVVVNKADGDNVEKAQLAAAQIKNAIHLFAATESGWIPKVEICSSINDFNIEKIWNIVEDYVKFTKNNQYFNFQREEQLKKNFYNALNNNILERFFDKNKEKIDSSLAKVVSGEKNVYDAVFEIDE